MSAAAAPSPEELLERAELRLVLVGRLRRLEGVVDRRDHALRLDRLHMKDHASAITVRLVAVELTEHVHAGGNLWTIEHLKGAGLVLGDLVEDAVEVQHGGRRGDSTLDPSAK